MSNVQTPRLQVAGFNFRRQAARRVLVVTTFLSLPFAATPLYLLVAEHLLWPLVIALPALLVAMFGWWVLNQVALPYAARREEAQTDERQESVRNRAMFQAYQWICAAVGLGLMYWMLAATLPKYSLWFPKAQADFDVVFYSFLFISITLPHAIIAWTEPDFDEEF